MLGTAARYAEYGITGGFFLFTQALILGFAFTDTLVWGANISLGVLLPASVGKIPPLVEPAIQSLLVAIALLSVFIIGLVLEIAGSMFVAGEAGIFRDQLTRNLWIAKFVEAELPDYAEDYRLFLDLMDKSSTYSGRLKELTSSWWFWIPLAGAFAYTYQSTRRVQRPLRRLEFSLMAKVLASGAKTEMLADQISICRMSRGIAAALYVVGLEVLLLPYFGEYTWIKLILLFLIAILIMSGAWLISVGAYSRFANILFSLVYASWKPQTRP